MTVIAPALSSFWHPKKKKKKTNGLKIIHIGAGLICFIATQGGGDMHLSYY